ncbi:hypothetical protein FPV16_23470 [Methylobacterium sp. W2]|uniref:hypothetical protein n=1 Tax=Methylobacterium sp. W2 TaxID=2598107 RepID=UPI001D0C72B6|nr:hypothetical protein [Methylobacterium sp. W2]MCC0809123.1 hypothetical protein [Methylobacterium sp. W2]
MKTRRPRTMKRMSVEADAMCVSDRLFFERFPWRQHRFRRLAQAELAQLEEATGAILFVPSQAESIFVLVKNLAPGVRLRMHVLGPNDQTGDDATEEMVSAFWKARAARCPDVIRQEVALQKAMRLPGGPLHNGGAA